MPKIFAWPVEELRPPYNTTYLDINAHFANKENTVESFSLEISQKELVFFKQCIYEWFEVRSYDLFKGK